LLIKKKTKRPPSGGENYERIRTETLRGSRRVPAGEGIDPLEEAIPERKMRKTRIFV